jgi:RNA polymerase sigma-70 factor (ECF subfamily)
VTVEGAPVGRPAILPAETRCREWYEAHGASVYGYLRFHLATADQAEDLTSEVFLRALRAADRFDPSRGSPRNWLLRIARNTLRDHLRRERRRRPAGGSARPSIMMELA